MSDQAWLAGTSLANVACRGPLITLVFQRRSGHDLADFSLLLASPATVGDRLTSDHTVWQRYVLLSVPPLNPRDLLALTGDQTTLL
jgi:hypothetical protein